MWHIIWSLWEIKKKSVKKTKNNCFKTKKFMSGVYESVKLALSRHSWSVGNLGQSDGDLDPPPPSPPPPPQLPSQNEKQSKMESAAWLSRVRHGTVRVRHGSAGCGMAQLGCGMTQSIACRAAVSRPRVRISAWHPSGDPLPELAAMKKLEWNEWICVNVHLYSK